MAYKIDLTASDQTGPAFDSAAQNTAKLDSASQSLDSTLTGLEQQFGELKADLAAIEQQEKEVAAAAGKAEQSIEGMGNASAGSAAGLGTATVAGEKMLGVFLRMMALKEILMKVAQGISYLAETGNPAAEGLVERFKKLQETLVKLGETEQFQYMLDGVAGGIDVVDDTLAGLTDTANDSESAFSQFFRGMQGGFNMMTTQLAEMTGIVQEGTSETLFDMNLERDVRAANHADIMEKKKEEARITKQMADVAKMEAELKKARIDEQLVAEAKEITSLEEISKLQERELENLRKLSREGNLTAEEQQRSGKIVEVMEARKKEIQAEAAAEAERLIEEGTEKEKQAQEQRTEEAKRQTEARKKLEQDAAKAREDAEKKATDAAKKQADERAKAFQDHVERLKSAMEKMSPDGKQNEALSSMFNGAASRGNAAKALINDRQKQAEDEVKAKFNASGARDASTGEFSNKDQQAAYNRELANAKRTAKKETVRDIRSGEADADLNNKQAEIAQSMISRGEASGQLGKANAEAMRQTVEAMARLENQNVENRNAIEEQRRFVANIGKEKGKGINGGGGSNSEGSPETMAVGQATADIGQQAANMGQSANKAIGNAITVLEKHSNEISRLAESFEQQSRFLQDLGNTSTRRVDQRRNG